MKKMQSIKFPLRHSLNLAHLPPFPSHYILGTILSIPQNHHPHRPQTHTHFSGLCICGSFKSSLAELLAQRHFREAFADHLSVQPFSFTCTDSFFVITRFLN